MVKRQDMKKSLPLYIAVAVLLLGLLMGSFYDLEIAKALFNDRHWFGLILAAFGTLPGYGLLAIFSGFLVCSELKFKHENIYLRLLLFAASLAAFGLSTYYQGKEIFSTNAFDNKDLKWLGFIISFILMSGLAYLGYWLGNKYSTENSWKILLTGLLICGMAILSATVVKVIFSRPRYRSSVLAFGDDWFFNWWEIAHVDKVFPAEEYKSFPSGHACGTAMAMVLLPYLTMLIPSIKKWFVPSFYIAFGWTLVVCFSRMLVGAHYLSDVSMGALLVCIWYVVGDILMKKYLRVEVSE